MTYQPFLIANTRIGIERDIEPFLLPQDAYPDLQNCFMFRGRILKREGFNLVGRLQRVVGTTNGAGNLTVTLLGYTALLTMTAGASSFRVGSTSYQDNGAANPDPQNLLVNGIGTATLDRGTGGNPGQLIITGGPANTSVIYIPGLPVMGLRSLETATGNQDSLVGFDTHYSYLFSAGVFVDLTTYKTSGASFSWHGTDSQFFWTTNYQQAMFTSNYVPGMDAIRYNTLTAGATTSIVFTGVNVTASFQVNDYVFVYPDATTTTFPTVGSTVEFQGSGQVTSSTFAAGDTTIVIAVVTTTNSNTGTLFNVTRQLGNGTTVGDGIKWLDQDLSGWVNFQPPLNGSGTSTVYLQSALMMFSYKGNLVCLNTIEDTFTAGTPKKYLQRARWSQVGTVYYSSPIPTSYRGGTDPQAWRDDVAGKGGFIDAPTLEAIVSAQFIKDTLVVYFETSTWQLQYTGNTVTPFVWVKINTELGAESTFSVVPFDRQTIAIGNVGIHACDTVNVQRIDAKIPDEVFQIQNINQGPKRVYGIRDYFKELVYWTLPYDGIDSEEDDNPSTAFTYPNKIMVYNYKDQAFSFFDDSFTCFGYLQPSSGILWSSDVKWGSDNVLWVSAQDNAFSLNVIGGNQQGFVEMLMRDVFNDDSLFISNISGSTITSPNHNLQAGQFIKITSASGITSGLNAIYKVISVTNANTFVIEQAVVGTFTGSGTITLVNNFSILTKRFNPFLGEASQCRLGYADYYFDKTTHGQITVRVFNNEDSSVPIDEPPLPPISTVSSNITAITAANPCVITVENGALFSANQVLFVTNVQGMTQINFLSFSVVSVLGNNITTDLDASTFSAYTTAGILWNISKNTLDVLNTYPESTYTNSPDLNLVNDKLWKRMYYQDIAQLFQFQITYSDSQMRCEPIVASDIGLHALMPWFSKSGRLINA